MREIVQGVFTWPWFSERHGYDFNGHLVLDPGGNICIDPVEPGQDVLGELARHGVAQIVITNRNHVRAANAVRERTGASTIIHAGDAAYAKEQGAVLDAELQSIETIGPLRVVGVPGKSPGEIALFWPERRILIVGDAVIGNPAGQCGLLREKVMDDPGRLRQSVRKLLELDFDTLLFGDGVAILGGAKQELAKLVGTFPAE